MLAGGIGTSKVLARAQRTNILEWTHSASLLARNNKPCWSWDAAPRHRSFVWRVSGTLVVGTESLAVLRFVGVVGVYIQIHIYRHKYIYLKQVCPGAGAFAICSWLNPLPSDLNIARISSYRKFHSTLVSGILGISAALPPNLQSLVQDGRLHYPPGYWLHLFGHPVSLFSELF